MNLIFISDEPASSWFHTASEALLSLGKLRFLPAIEAPRKIFGQKCDLFIIDASTTKEDIAMLVGQLHCAQQETPIIVVTTSPTWRRARAVFLAGAADYIPRTFDKDKILSSCQEALTRSQRFSSKSAGSDDG
ncbi:MAG: hypothetical protein L0332_10800 [Chloroflexi bacterium]|nr:hypothetical protein [Chloroflexota bacterium]MCI0581156.1 hypothetical protein [Chloroflexota bacterium]MCI0645374.1 hypothetical protein [Chloroflexota bacterium]MCI0727195.1 hypothetical protein [Chloroflexota bacterium]